MYHLPAESRAIRQELFASLAALFLGFFGTLALLIWVVVHFATPETRWWDILHTIINSIFVAILAGLACCAVTAIVLSKIHYGRGVYRCNFCGRPLRGPGIPCSCRAGQA